MHLQTVLVDTVLVVLVVLRLFWIQGVYMRKKLFHLEK